MESSSNGSLEIAGWEKTKSRIQNPLVINFNVKQQHKTKKVGTQTI